MFRNSSGIIQVWPICPVHGSPHACDARSLQEPREMKRFDGHCCAPQGRIRMGGGDANTVPRVEECPSRPARIYRNRGRWAGSSPLPVERSARPSNLSSIRPQTVLGCGGVRFERARDQRHGLAVALLAEGHEDRFGLALHHSLDQLQGGRAHRFPCLCRRIVATAQHGRVRVLVPAVHAIGVKRLVDGNDAGEESGKGRQVEIDVKPEILVRRHEDEVDEGAPEHHARRAVGGAAWRPVRDKT